MIEWRISGERVPYPEAVAEMSRLAAEIAEGAAPERVWLLEHPPVYTRGASARDGDLRDADRFPVFETERGGQFTYHGPGQRVAYVMLNLAGRGRDVRGFVCGLEGWIIDALARFNIKGERRAGRVGVWIDRTAPGGPVREDKVAAIGVRVRRWVTSHGISINLDPDLDHFQGITPCGQADPAFGVTSFEALGRLVSMAELDAALRTTFEARFGETILS